METDKALERYRQMGAYYDTLYEAAKVLVFNPLNDLDKKDYDTAMRVLDLYKERIAAERDRIAEHLRWEE